MNLADLLESRGSMRSNLRTMLGIKKIKALYILGLILFSLVLALGSTSQYSEIKKQIFSKNFTYKAIKDLNRTLNITIDGPMYLVLQESLKSNLLATSKEESINNLLRKGLNIDSQAGRDLVYLAHTDRGRLLYPLLNLIVEPILGQFSYLTLNIFAYALIIMLYIKMIGIKTHTHLILLLLAGSTIPTFIFSAMPELFIYLLTTCYLLHLFTVYVDSSFHSPLYSLRRPKIAVALLIFALLMKPVFVVLIPAQFTAMLLCSRHLRPQLFLQLGISLSFFLAWILSKATNSSPLALGVAQNPIKSVISSANSQIDQNFPRPKIPIETTIPTIISEVNAQIDRLQSAPLIILIFIFFIAVLYASLKLNLFLASIFIGAILTQIHGGGLGTNLRTLNIFLTFSFMIVGSILSRTEFQP
jgi:hypothetical protein